MLDTEITATGILLRSARGGTTTTIPTHAPPMASMDRAGLSAVCSSAPAPGTTVTGVAVATTAAADTTVVVDTMVAADITAEAIAVGSGTPGPVAALTADRLAMQVVATHSQVELAVSTAIASAQPAASTAVAPAADSMAAAVVVTAAVAADTGKYLD